MKTKMIFAIAAFLMLGSVCLKAQGNSKGTTSTERTIHVATAGTLPNLISEDEKYQIEELTLTGELNGTDFKFIREMAGDIVSLDHLDGYVNVVDIVCLTNMIE